MADNRHDDLDTKLEIERERRVYAQVIGILAAIIIGFLAIVVFIYLLYSPSNTQYTVQRQTTVTTSPAGVTPGAPITEPVTQTTTTRETTTQSTTP